MINSPNQSYKEMMFKKMKFAEARRDYHSSSVMQVNHLIQIDEKPNLELTEPKWELYKISISFKPICKFYLTELTVM